MPYLITKRFEEKLCEYTGARHAVALNSGSAALLLSCQWHRRAAPGSVGTFNVIEIPRRTYVSVPCSIILAGFAVEWRDERWRGVYQLKPLPVWDCARIFTSGMWDRPGGMACVSFHWSKTLGIQQGGAILHDSTEADHWLRRARFDGRLEGVAPKNQDPRDWIVGWHAYMAPETAAAGLVRLATLPQHNDPLPWGPGTDSDYPDLSTLDIFK